jgi:hypothetical protein
MITKVQIPVSLEEGTPREKQNKDYFVVKDEYMKLIHQFRENLEDQFIGGMPIQLEKKCMFMLLKEKNDKFVYGMTLKADGVRHLMFLSRSGVIYFIDRVTNIFYFQIGDAPVRFNKTDKPFLFDGELLFHEKTNTWEFLLFDVVYFNGVYTMYDNYYSRLNVIQTFLPTLENILHVASANFLHVSTKEWYTIDTMLLTENIYSFIIKDTNDKRKKNGKLPLKDDGLILQPFDETYVPFREWAVYNNVQFKWKPANQLTIDFKIRMEKPNEWWLLTKTGQAFQVKQPDGENVNAICIPTNKNKEEYRDNDIVEFKLKSTFNPQNNIFVAIQKRPDKTEGNSYNTAMSTMEVIKNNFVLDELKESIAILKFKKEEEYTKVLELYPKSNLILCTLLQTGTLFFSDLEVKKLKEVYIEYITLQQNKRTVPVPMNVLENNPFLAGILSQRPVYEAKKQKKSSYELECRIFPFIQKKLFNADESKTIKKGMYFYILSFLFKSGYHYEKSFSIDIILNEYNPSGKYRSTYSTPALTKPDNEFKEKVRNAEGKVVEFVMKPTNTEKLYNNLTMKVSLSNEIKTNQKIGLKTQLHDRVVYNVTRTKRRYSFYVHEHWRVDITRVQTDYGKINSESQQETYELECEFIGKGLSPDDFVYTLNDICVMLMKNSGYCF